VAALAAVCGVAAHAYSVSSYKWAYSPVLFYVNPANADVSSNAAEAAVRAGMDVWNTQAGIPFRYQFGGRVNDTSTGNDGRNVVIFRNATNGSTVASTYSWWSGGVRIDSDIIFWDAAYTFFTGTSGCSNGVYIEDFATHEFGHAMGLQHSNLVTATMFPSTGWCMQEWRTLSEDDIEGAQHLYGTAAAASNTAPTVSILTPLSGSVFPEGAVISFSGVASDVEDGNLTAQLSWLSTLQGAIGTGGAFSGVLSVGSHTIKARVTDSGGLTTVKQVSVTVSASEPDPQPSPVPTGPTLEAYGYKVRAHKKVDLAWAGFTGSQVDVYRNGTRIGTTANDGVHTDSIGGKGGGTYTYEVCEVGSTTCSNEDSVVF
jgi:hypothetical protein